MDKKMIYQEITKQIRDIYGVTSLDLKTSINSFNAVSEDNDEFLRRFQKEFQVDMNGFNYYDFFNEDQFYSLAFVRPIMRLFRKERKKPLLTIEHLVNVAENRKWSSPV
jgi:hypothetical protein